MNLGQLKAKVIERLRERSTPVHWTTSEIVDAINRGCKKFISDAKIKETMLPLSPASNDGEFFFPSRIMKHSGVFWNGKKLEHLSADYLDNFYGGNVSQFSRGDAQTTAADWRALTAETPTAWLIEDGLVRLFPIPTSLRSLFNPNPTISSSVGRSHQESTLAAGATVINFANNIPQEEDMIDLFLNGVYQNSDQWSITGAKQITMIGSLAADCDVEITQYDGLTLATTHTLSLAAGVQIITLPSSYLYLTSSVTVKINGITQAPSTFNKSGSYTITLSAPLVAASSVEVKIYEYELETENIDTSSFDVKMRCVRLPVDMSADADNPDMPTHLEDYHDCLWMWALVECYSREGQEKDAAMVQFYAQLYNQKLNEYRQNFGAPISFSPVDPWMV
jgi:hypothetical protein